MSPFLKRTLSVAVATVLAPAVLLGTTGPAVAATNTLTITAINRSGAKVSLWATVVNLATNTNYQVRTNAKRKLPKGDYAVLANIRTGNTDTLGGRTVRVSGASKLTVDARKGKPVKLALNPSSTPAPEISGAICGVSGNGADYSVESWGGDGRMLYAIPTASKKIAFAAIASWSDGSGFSDSYAVLQQTIGVPGNPSRTFPRSRLATMAVETRLGATGTPYSNVRIKPGYDDNCAGHLRAPLWNRSEAYTARVHLSPGKWHVNADLTAYTAGGAGLSLGGESVTRTVSAGRSYFVRFFGAAFGPGFYLPMTSYGRIVFPLDDMFRNPADYSGFGSSVAGEQAKATLRFGGKVVKTKYSHFSDYMPTLEYRVKKAGWYTITNTATRYHPDLKLPSGTLSTGSTVTFRFYAKPKTSVLAQVFSVQHVPAGLNSYNRAKPGSVTNVAIKLNRYLTFGDIKRGANPKLKSLATKVSFDGGRIWRSVPVKKLNGGWVAVVTNPASGVVSIRTRATYTNGGYTEAGIQRAYGIG